MSVNRHNLLAIPARLMAGQPATYGPILRGGNRCFLQSVQTCPRTHSFSYPMGTRGSFLLFAVRGTWSLRHTSYARVQKLTKIKAVYQQANGCQPSPRVSLHLWRSERHRDELLEVFAGQLLVRPSTSSSTPCDCTSTNLLLQVPTLLSNVYRSSQMAKTNTSTCLTSVRHTFLHEAFFLDCFISFSLCAGA